MKDLAYDVLAAAGSSTSRCRTTSTATCARCTRCSCTRCTVPGLSDGGAHCTMIADFDYPTFLLELLGPRRARRAAACRSSRWSSSRAPTPPRWSAFTTAACSQPGKRADVNLVDHAAVGSTAPSIVSDLPGGGARLVSHGTGYVATLVAGEVVFDAGVHTGATARRTGSCLTRRWSTRSGDDHVVAELDDGWVLLHVDRHLVHDVTSPGAFTTARRTRPPRAVAAPDVRGHRSQRVDHQRAHRRQQSPQPRASCRCCAATAPSTT